MKRLTVGADVHYVLTNGEHRPAKVVRPWGSTCANLVVFLDGSNDRYDIPNGQLPHQMVEFPHTGNRHVEHPLVHWATSASYSETMESGTWHYPEEDI